MKNVFLGILFLVFTVGSANAAQKFEISSEGTVKNLNGKKYCAYKKILKYDEFPDITVYSISKNFLGWQSYRKVQPSIGKYEENGPYVVRLTGDGYLLENGICSTKYYQIILR